MEVPIAEKLTSFGLQVTFQALLLVVAPKRHAYTGLMDERYDIYYAAGILEDFEEATVRANLAKLFKAGDAALEKLFSGNPQPVKRGVDKSAALKYKTAMNRAGAVAIIKKSAAPAIPADAPVTYESTAPAAPAAVAAEPKPQSMADRLAALTTSGGTTAATMTLAPTGSEILSPEERRPQPAPELDLSKLSIADAPDFEAEKKQAKAPRPDPEPEPLPQPVLESAPDTSHLTMGEVGEAIPLLAEAAAALDPDTSHLSLGAVGEEIPNLASAAAPLNPDTSAISLAPAGSDVLETQYRKTDTASAPSTDHIQLESTAAE
jgi:hypothetical protein